MKINENSLAGAAASSAPAAAQPVKPQAGRSPAGNATEGQDTADVSNLASQLLDGTAARVERLKQIYEEGKYSVPAADIAARLVDETKAE